MGARFYEIALRLSKKSPHKQHRMAAVVVRGGAIVACATNGNKWKRHAEIRCLKFGVSGDMIVVARAGNRMSKPCSMCLHAIKEAGIKRIVYSGWDGILREERVQ